jgi:hypothetical protein
LQYSGRAVEIMGTKKVETSLQTPDRQEAEIRAFDQIKAHKLTLLILRNQREQTIQTRSHMHWVSIEPTMESASLPLRTD